MVIGSHVHQAGSFVCKDYGRFDFTHYEKVTNEQLKEVERLVNEQIALNVPVVTELMDIEDAKKTGAMALFDEKYDDVVRVVSMGEFSKELCGGTHVSNTSELGIFKIISEESIGSGIRRITSKTNFGAYLETLAQQEMLEQAADSLKIKTITQVNEKVDGLIAENARLNKVIAELKDKLAAASSAELTSKAVEVNGLKMLVEPIENGELKPMAEQLVNKLKDAVVVLYSNKDGKISFAAGCSKSAIAAGYNAGKLVKTIAQACGGNGGGKPELAQAGGKDAAKLPEAIAMAKNLLGM